MRARAVFHIARADFLERVRRYSFLVTVLFAIFLGYGTATGEIALRLGKFRGVYTSGWIGTDLALVAACFISLVGFYIVKNAVERDRTTRVGEILASTPLTRFEYALGKWLSNSSVLTAQVAILALASLVMQVTNAEDLRPDLWALLAPFLLLALPVMALVGAVALLFESLPVLRGGIGNVVWFFAWAMGIAVAAVSGIKWLDPSGLAAAMGSITRAARAAIPGYHGEFEFRIDPTHPPAVAANLHWYGLRWDLPQVMLRLEWVGVALLLVLLATLFFDRFDPARRRLPSGARRRLLPRRSESCAARESVGGGAGISGARTAAHLTPLSAARSRGLSGIFRAELRLALKGHPWWWYAASAGLLVAECAAPLKISRGPLLTVAWIWPILLWSAMGEREARHGTEQLVFSAPRVLERQLPAAWLAGVAVAVVAGGGVALRLLMASDFPGLLGWFAGALFIPALALALGVWTKSRRAFEGIFTALWYTGPLNHVPGVDFTGGANGPHTAVYACGYLILTALLLAAAFFGRWRQLRGA